MRSIGWIFKFLSGSRLMFGAACLFLFIETGSYLATIGLQKWIIDDVFVQRRFEKLYPVISLFAGAMILFAVFRTWGPHLLHRVQYALETRLSQELLRYLYRIPMQELNRERTARYVHYFTSDVASAASTLAMTIPRGIQQLFNMVVLAAAVCLSSPVLLGVALLFGIAYIALGTYFAPRLKAAAKTVQEKKSDVLVALEEGISSTREVVAFHRIGWEAGQMKRQFAAHLEAVLEEGKLINRQMWYSEPLQRGVRLVFLGYAGYAVVEGSLTLGSFVIVYYFITQLMNALHGVYQFAMGLSGRLASVERLQHLLRGKTIREGTVPLVARHPTPPDDYSAEAHGGPDDGETGGKEGAIRSIRFEAVSFRYEPELPNVLEQLSLDIPIGGKVAFAGSSGGGKSTVAQLLLRLYEPTAGAIRVNGHDLADIRRDDWSTHTAIVMQDNYLYADTIRNNLLIGRSWITDERMMDACRDAQIHDDIMQLPDGYGTLIGERGVTLSGGQRQRLAIARALLADADLLILDEATSALDMETERRLMKRLDAVRQGRTTVLIAHRLSTIQNADVIYVLEGGRVAESGTFEELMNGQSHFRKLIELSAAAG